MDQVVPETSWEQKHADIERYAVSVFGIGTDWQGKFDDPKDLCEVIYLPRTQGISTTELKSTLRILDQSHVQHLKQALDVISTIIAQLE